MRKRKVCLLENYPTSLLCLIFPLRLSFSFVRLEKKSSLCSSPFHCKNKVLGKQTSKENFCMFYWMSLKFQMTWCLLFHVPYSSYFRKEGELLCSFFLAPMPHNEMVIRAGYIDMAWMVSSRLVHTLSGLPSIKVISRYAVSLFVYVYDISWWKDCLSKQLKL